MRQIKFRVWDKESKKMYSVQRLDFFEKFIASVVTSFGRVIANIVSNGENDIIMQFTGFLDIDGKEIYEGDIVKIPEGYVGDHFYKDCIAIIKFKKGSFIPYNTKDKNGIVWQGWNWQEIEVIGNIYEDKQGG